MIDIERRQRSIILQNETDTLELYYGSRQKPQAIRFVRRGFAPRFFQSSAVARRPQHWDADKIGRLSPAEFDNIVRGYLRIVVCNG